MKRVAFLLTIAASMVMAESFSWHESVKVIRSEPTYRTVTIRTPIEECWDEEVPVSRNSDGTLGAIIGGAAGGILGHQVGKGSGKTAATIGGAVIGTLVGKSLAQRNARPGYRMVRRCRTKYSQERDVVIEYKNFAKVQGRTIVKYSDRPLNTIPVTITIEY